MFRVGGCAEGASCKTNQRRFPLLAQIHRSTCDEFPLPIAARAIRSSRKFLVQVLADSPPSSQHVRLIGHARYAQRCVRVHRGRGADVALGMQKVHHLANRRLPYRRGVLNADSAQLVLRPLTWAPSRTPSFQEWHPSGRTLRFGDFQT